jgi:ubiquinone/menaquinone biosynthesis C-methylase UbiE
LAKRVGPQGAVVGVDASPEMITAAQSKAGEKAGSPTFQVAPAQDLPFADGSFDAVTTSLLIHHLPPDDRVGAIREMLRVLRPGGRLLIVEFQAPRSRTGKGITRHLFGHAMADNTIEEVAAVVTAGGAAGVECHPSGVGWLGLVTASKQVAGN